jgi:hypothetical protein
LSDQSVAFQERVTSIENFEVLERQKNDGGASFSLQRRLKPTFS